jgi:hypothetical protein
VEHPWTSSTAVLSLARLTGLREALAYSLAFSSFLQKARLGLIVFRFSFFLIHRFRWFFTARKTSGSFGGIYSAENQRFVRWFLQRGKPAVHLMDLNSGLFAVGTHRSLYARFPVFFIRSLSALFLRCASGGVVLPWSEGFGL